jgi:hypothetical protein
MVIEDIDGQIFGGHTSIEWKLLKSHCSKGDESTKSFLLSLKNSHNGAAQKSASKTEEKQKAINCFPDVKALRTPG